MTYLSSHDLIAEQAELESRDDLDDDERERLDAIRELADEGIPDWLYGATLIPESEFEGYARDFADDIGAVADNAGWPHSHIDWKAAADELRQDFTEVEFMGETYLVR